MSEYQNTSGVIKSNKYYKTEESKTLIRNSFEQNNNASIIHIVKVEEGKES